MTHTWSCSSNWSSPPGTKKRSLRCTATTNTPLGSLQRAKGAPVQIALLLQTQAAQLDTATSKTVDAQRVPVAYGPDDFLRS